MLVVKGARVGDFNGKTLSTVGSSTVLIDPVDVPEAGTQRSWWVRGWGWGRVGWGVSVWVGYEGVSICGWIRLGPVAIEILMPPPSPCAHSNAPRYNYNNYLSTHAVKCSGAGGGAEPPAHPMPP